MIPSGVIFLKQLGDFILLQPALARLAASGDGRVALATKPAFRELYPLLDGVEAVPMENAGPLGELHVYEHGSKASWRAFLTRAKTKTLLLPDEARYRWYHGLIFNDIRLDLSRRDYRALYYYRNTPPFGEEGFVPPRLLPPPSGWRHHEQPEAPYVVIHPTSAWKRKCWTIDGWVQVMEALHREGSGRFILTASSVEWEVEYCREIAGRLPFPVLNLAGKTTLKEYAALLQAAALTVAVDGSASHLSQAFGGACLTLFGPSVPSEWHWPSEKSKALGARAYTGDADPRAEVIPPMDVVDSVLSLWRGRSG